MVNHTNEVSVMVQLIEKRSDDVTKTIEIVGLVAISRKNKTKMSFW